MNPSRQTESVESEIFSPKNQKLKKKKKKNFFFSLSLSKLLRFGVSVISGRSVVLFLFGYIHSTAENGICIGEALKVPKGPAMGHP